MCKQIHTSPIKKEYIDTKLNFHVNIIILCYQLLTITRKCSGCYLENILRLNYCTCNLKIPEDHSFGWVKSGWCIYVQYIFFLAAITFISKINHTKNPNYFSGTATGLGESHPASPGFSGTRNSLFKIGSGLAGLGTHF